MLPASISSGSSAAAHQQQQRRAASSSSSAAPSAPATALPPWFRNPSRKPPTGYVWSELMFWHNPGEIGDLASRVQPTRHLEHAETKRRLHNLVGLSGLLSSPSSSASSSSPRSSPSPSGGRSSGSGSGSSKRSGPALVEIEPRMATIAELER
jgi:hypothetical protein